MGGHSPTRRPAKTSDGSPEAVRPAQLKRTDFTLLLESGAAVSYVRHESSGVDLTNAPTSTRAFSCLRRLHDFRHHYGIRQTVDRSRLGLLPCRTTTHLRLTEGSKFDRLTKVSDLSEVWLKAARLVGGTVLPRKREGYPPQPGV